MAAALGTYSAVSASKPRRVEGHTSNVEVPILYAQFFKLTVAETTEAGDTYIIPHKFKDVQHINLTPLSAAGAEALLGDISDGTDGAYVANASSVYGPTQITTAASAGASTVILTGLTALANDTLNNCWLEIRFDNGNTQVVKITDFATTTATATLAEPLAHAIASTGTFYIVRGTLLTIASSAATPAFSAEVYGYFE